MSLPFLITLVSGLSSILTDYVEEGWDGVQDFVEDVSDGLPDFVQDFADGFQDFAIDVVSVGKSAIETIADVAAVALPPGSIQLFDNPDNKSRRRKLANSNKYEGTKQPSLLIMAAASRSPERGGGDDRGGGPPAGGRGGGRGDDDRARLFARG